MHNFGVLKVKHRHVNKKNIENIITRQMMTVDKWNI